MAKMGGWRAWVAAGMAWAAMTTAWAAGVTIKDIRLEGLQTVDPGTVFASLPFRSGDEYTDDQGSTAIRALYALGLFQDVKLDVQDDVIVIAVRERSRLQEISFDGLVEFKSDMMLRLLKDVGVAADLPFDKALVDRAEQEIKRQYLNRSLYAVQVVSTVTPLPNNRVNLHMQVIEGDVAKIRELRIVGAKAFKESTLLDELDQNTGTWLSWYTKSDRYSQAKLSGDLERLRAYYLTRGFLEFRIDSTQVAITPDKDRVSITVNITEGQRFAVAGVKLEGDFLGREESFASRVAVQVGQAYNVDEVTQTVEAFRDYYGEFGYAFARVQAVPEVDRDKGQVTMVLRGQPQQRVYVRRIEVAGNHTTRDAVIRREFRQMESAWYDGKRIRQSRDRVDRLGFFTNVGIDHRVVPNSPDQVDLVITVEEKPTGSLNLGVGYSQADKLSLTAGIQQDNVFGSGNSLSLGVDTSSYNRSFSINATDPYFTDSGISRSFGIYYKTTRPYSSQEGDYKLVRTGASVSFGVPFTEDDTVFVGLGLEGDKVNAGSQLPEVYNTFVQEFGSPATGVPLTLGWSRDTRDSRLAPTQGRYQRANGVMSLAGDMRYATAAYQFQQYWPLGRKYTIAFNTELNAGWGLNGRSLPIFKYFTGGGLGSVRGFQQGTLGGTSTLIGSTTEANVGGERSFVANLEFIAPVPGSGNDRTLRWFGFIDAGNVYCSASETVHCGSNALRASSGIGLSWISPVGPLRFAWAKPLRKQPDDKLQAFQFQIGTSF